MKSLSVTLLNVGHGTRGLPFFTTAGDPVTRPLYRTLSSVGGLFGGRVTGASRASSRGPLVHCEAGPRGRPPATGVTSLPGPRAGPHLRFAPPLQSRAAGRGVGVGAAGWKYSDYYQTFSGGSRDVRKS